MVFSTTRTAIVTGAAHGIGAGIATRLAQEGVRVAAIDLDGRLSSVISNWTGRRVFRCMTTARELTWFS